MEDQSETQDKAIIDEVGERELSWYHYIGDLANITKAFIGTNYLAVAFGFSQAGLIPGICGLILIAVLTDHGCQLMVRCKHRIIRFICALYPNVLEEDCTKVRIKLERTVGYGDLAHHVLGEMGYHVVQASVFITQYLTCVQYFIFLGNSIHKMFPVDHHSNSTINHTLPTAEPISTAPNLKLLILIPLPIILLLILIQRIRLLSPFSAIASSLLVIGALGVFVYVCKGFHITSNFDYAKLYTLPIFFGQLTNSYEGIGCVLPIESSMDGNRYLFPTFLRVAIAFVWVILVSFGILGYLRYGNTVNQLIILSLENISVVTSILINVTLMTSVIFTFPLQAFPVWQIAECYIFSGHCRPKKSILCGHVKTALSVSRSESESLLNDVSHQSSYGTTQTLEDLVEEEKIPLWKKNVLRTILLFTQVGLAILLKDAFAYVSAFTGAIGSSLLSYILPCTIHLKARWVELKKIIIFKDFLILIFATVASTLTIVLLIYEIVKGPL
ncbi:DgyrCDS2560 [Dimorphilus gyrociliatus]|uniref:DgyrCDS2560 n=1 Tax=Dimorphilus gyrociliatus TaxID=2664684 RepID=A0A7I8VCL9_9ANNE|nr:DgyrCDS2560 [Dimorphilus gyrociliatus]